MPELKPEPAAHSTAALLRRLILFHVRPHVGRLLLSVVFMAVTAAMTAANAWLMQPALDKVFVARDANYLLWVPLAVIAVALVKGVASYAEGTIMSGVGQRIISDTQVAMYAHLMRADLAWLQRIHSGQLVSSFLYDATLLRDAVSRALTGMVKDSLSVIFLVAVMFQQDWRMSLVVCAVFPAVGVYSRKLGRKTRKGSTRSQVETGKLTTILSETFEGVRLVKAYGMEDRETARARASVETRLGHMMKVIRARAAAGPATEALGGIAVAVAIYFGGLRAVDGEMTLGSFAAFVTALLLAYQPVKSLATLNTALQEGLAAAQRLFAMLDVAPTVRDVPNAPALRVSGGGVRFDTVRFAYADGTEALRGVSIDVAPGSKVALVGPSGAGKTTLLNLIPRFYDPTSGRVLIDGQDVLGVSLTSLRAAMALVSQELTLFDDTVRANIAYGRANAGEAEIVQAAKAADAHDFIMRLPQGYDTMVGENGVKLSGGQRQRIAIARAMLRDAPILLLDEATSALDADAERKVQAALRRLMQGRTTIVIAHRLSTVIDADAIFVIDHGQVVETGRHAELLASGGTYARLYATQFAGEAQPAAS